MAVVTVPRAGPRRPVPTPFLMVTETPLPFLVSASCPLSYPKAHEHCRSQLPERRCPGAEASLGTCTQTWPPSMSGQAVWRAGAGPSLRSPSSPCPMTVSRLPAHYPLQPSCPPILPRHLKDPCFFI